MYLDINQRVIFGCYLRFVPSGLFASVLVPCRTALCLRSSVHGPHTNGTPCTSALLWCGPFVSYSSALAVPSLRPAHRQDVIVYRLHCCALSALVHTIVPFVVCTRPLPRLSRQSHCHCYHLINTGNHTRTCALGGVPQPFKSKSSGTSRHARDRNKQISANLT